MQSVKDRLVLWGITEEQIQGLEKDRKSKILMTIGAPSDGTVVWTNVERGKYIKEGDELYKISDITKLWLWVEIYESDISLVRPDQKIRFTTITHPGETFDGVVASKALVLEKTRTSRLLISVENQAKKLVPGLFATVTIEVPLDEKGQPQTVVPRGDEKVVYDC